MSICGISVAVPLLKTTKSNLKSTVRINSNNLKFSSPSLLVGGDLVQPIRPSEIIASVIISYLSYNSLYIINITLKLNYSDVYAEQWKIVVLKSVVWL